MKTSFWIGLGMDLLGALLLTVGIFLVIESPNTGFTLITVATLLMVAGTMVMVIGGISTGMSGVSRSMAQMNSGMQWGQQMMAGAAGVQSGSANPTKRSRLEQIGVVADGNLTQARNTGLTNGTAGVVDLDLEVTIPGRPTYTLTLRESANPQAMPKLLPGTKLKVRVDPNNTLDAVVDWASSGLPAPY
jgi:hypothetical protein